MEIFIKTCQKDHVWLGFCLSSINKYAKNFTGITILTDTDHYNVKDHASKITTMPIRFRHLEVPQIVHNCYNGIGYLWMQSVKLNWHKFSDSDVILQIDSDCILTSTLTPEIYLSNNKYRWWVRPWSVAKLAIVHRKPLNKFLGCSSKYEHMLFNGWVLEKNTTIAFHEWVQKHHGCTWWEYLVYKTNNDWVGKITDPDISSYIRGRPRGSSVYNAFGGFLEIYEDTKKYYEITTDSDIIPPIKQYWSWGGIQKKQIAEIRNSLTRHDKYVDLSKVIESIGHKSYKVLTNRSILIDNVCVTTETEYWPLKKLAQTYLNKVLIVCYPDQISENIILSKYEINNTKTDLLILDRLAWLVDVDENFDHLLYEEQNPITKNYYQPWAKDNGISDRKRLFHHYYLYHI